MAEAVNCAPVQWTEVKFRSDGAAAVNNTPGGTAY